MTAALTEGELEAYISDVSMRNYRRSPDWDKSKILAWAAGLPEMSDADFVTECASRILDSAIMNRFRGNSWGTHARADICADESGRRHQAAGHTPDCRGENLYSKGHNAALKSQGHAPASPAPCTCGRGAANGKGRA